MARNAKQVWHACHKLLIRGSHSTHPSMVLRAVYIYTIISGLLLVLTFFCGCYAFNAFTFYRMCFTSVSDRQSHILSASSLIFFTKEPSTVLKSREEDKVLFSGLERCKRCSRNANRQLYSLLNFKWTWILIDDRCINWLINWIKRTILNC